MEEAITALLVHVAGGRRHWVRAPQGTALPFVVLTRISGQESYTHQGRARHVSSRLQADCYGQTYRSAKETARAVKAVLSGQRGGTLQGVFLDAERDLPAEDPGEVNRLFRVSLDFNVHHS